MASTTFSSKDVAELRARTSAGMMDCKKALEEAGGEMDKAVDILRRKGIAKAEKRAGRSASQGIVVVEMASDGTAGAMVEVNCETDFVARNETFQQFARELGRQLAEKGTDGIDAGNFDAQPYRADPSKTVAEHVTEMAGKTGEAISVRRWARFTAKNGVVGHYLHHNGSNGVLVEVDGATGPDALALAREIALHISFADPIGINAADVPAELIERERKVAEAQVAEEGKPEAIRGKIVDGKIRKFVAERTLLEQPFVREDKTTVGQLIKKAGEGITVSRFARFVVGSN
ncbi:MAG: translation elongation factor Ts [Gemmatimonadota bacterium]